MKITERFYLGCTRGKREKGKKEEEKGKKEEGEKKEKKKKKEKEGERIRKLTHAIRRAPRNFLERVARGKIPQAAGCC